MREALYILSDLGAQVIEITAASSSHIGHEAARDFNASIPEAVPVAGGSGASASRCRTTTSSESRKETTIVEFEQPKFRPHVGKKNWYLLREMQPPRLQRLVPKLQERRTNGTISLSFAGTQQFESLAELKVNLADVVGIGVVEKHSTLQEFEYKFNVKFYNEDAFHLASHRTQNWPKRLSFREDLRVPGERVVPIEEWLSNHGDVNTIPELLRAQGLLNVLYVPFVLYGPRGVDNSSVLFTWSFATLKALDTLHTEQTWMRLDRMLQNSRRQVGYETFMQNVRFDPRGGGVLKLRSCDQTIHDMRAFEQMRDKDVVKLLMYDTPDAKSLDRDVEGETYPPGLKILVLNGNMVNTLRKEREGAGEPTEDELQKHKAAWDEAKLLLGPTRPPAPTGVPIVIRLERYSPIACILKFDMEPELVPEAERDASAEMVSSELKITKVWPLVALSAPTSRADAWHLTNQLLEDQDAYVQRIEMLEVVAAEAVGVLNELFEFVQEIEYKLRRQADEAREESTYLQSSCSVQ